MRAVRIGIAFKGDAFRVQTQTQRLQLDLTRAKQQQRLAGARLVRTLHLQPLVELTPAEREPVPLALADLNTSPQELIRTALENRPELARSTALIAAAEESRRGAVYGPLLSTIGAQAFNGQSNGGPGHTWANGGPRADYTVGLSWKIGPGGLFDFGRIRASGANWPARSCPTKDCAIRSHAKWSRDTPVFNRSLDSYAWLGSTSTPRRKRCA